MSFLPAYWRDLSRSLPKFALALGIAFLVALCAEILCAVTRPWDSITFWGEFNDDRVAWWTSFLLVLAAPLVLRFCGGIPWRTIGRWLERNIILVAVSSALFYAAFMYWGGRCVANTPDEECAVLQARTFASFHITPQVSPDLARLVIPKWVQDDFVMFSAQSGRYTAIYWPGYALLMAPFARFSLEWLCNPVLTALSLFVLFRLVRRLTGSGEGGIWALLLMLSAPQIALGTTTYFSMPAHLLFNLLFCSLIVRDSKRAALGAGMIGGFALVLHNPVPHFSFALPWLVWVALKRRSHLVPLLLGYALLFLPVSLAWSAHLQTFDAGRYVKAAGISASAGELNKFAEVMSRIAYTVRLPSTYLWLSRAAAICKFIVWATPGAGGLALIAWIMVRRERRLPSEATASLISPTPQFQRDYLWLFGVSLVVNFGLYMFVRFDQGHGWGFRYLHQSWMVLAILPAYFLVSASSTWKKITALFCVSSLLVMIPQRAIQLNMSMDHVLLDGPPTTSKEPSITFIKEKGERIVFIDNDPFLRGSHWNLRSVSYAENEAVAKRYLANARKLQSGVWGERWQGTGFLRPGSSIR